MRSDRGGSGAARGSRRSRPRRADRARSRPRRRAARGSRPRPSATSAEHRQRRHPDRDRARGVRRAATASASPRSPSERRRARPPPRSGSPRVRRAPARAARSRATAQRRRHVAQVEREPERVAGGAGRRLGRDQVRRERERATSPSIPTSRSRRNSGIVDVSSQRSGAGSRHRRADDRHRQHGRPPRPEPGGERRLPKRAPEVRARQVVGDGKPVFCWSGGAGVGSTPPTLVHGSGLPTAIRLRTYQKPPARTSGPSHSAALASRRPRGASRSRRRSARAPARARSAWCRPRARPRPPRARAAPSPALGVDHDSATAASRKNTATTSFAALPACE